MKKSTRFTALMGQTTAQCLQACLIPHAPEPTGRNLHLTSSALLLHLLLLRHSSFTFPTGIILNYFTQDFSRRRCQNLNPTQPAAGLPQRQEVPSSSVRGPRNQTPLGERRLSPCPGRCEPVAHPWLTDPALVPTAAPASQGSLTLLSCADDSRSQTRRSLPALFQIIRNQPAKHRLLQASWKLKAEDP